MSRRRQRLTDLGLNILAALVVLAFVAGLAGLAMWARTSLPCEWFTVATAPVRCLPGAGQ